MTRCAEHLTPIEQQIKQALIEAEVIHQDETSLYIYKQKQEEQALKCFEQALSICKEIGDRRGEGVALGNLGKVYLDLGQHEEARKYFEQALVLSKEVGDREGESRMLDFLGRSRSES